MAGDLILPKEELLRTAVFLKDDPELSFHTLNFLTGVHEEEEPEQIVLVYCLFSMRHRHRIVVKTEIERPLAFPHFYLRVNSVSDIWPAADWLEREVYDMFGVHFVGHKDFRRLLLPADWEGHPLLKDYREADEYRGILTTREEVEAVDYPWESVTG